MNKGLFAVVCVVAGVAAGAALHLGGQLMTAPADSSAHASDDAGARPLASADVEPSSNSQSSTTPADSRARASAADERGDSARAPSAPVLSYHDGIMRASPSVVSLYAGLHERIAGGGDGGGPVPRVSQGSGVIVDPEGIVLTNLHLVEDADAINVVLDDGKLHIGRVVGRDRASDLAIVRIDPAGIPEGGFPFMRLDDAPPLRVGDVVLAIGNPYGVGQTVTQGIVSATRRRVAGGSPGQNLVQIDAAINPGNSGGALINPAGQLVGVTTAVFRGLNANVVGSDGRSDIDGSTGAGAQGIGYAIPAELLKQVVPEIISGGEVSRGWLGVNVDDLPRYPRLHQNYSRGAVITRVQSESPAQLGGLRQSDVVTAVDDRPIQDADDLLLLISSLQPGTVVPLAIERDERQLVLQIKLGTHISRGE